MNPSPDAPSSRPRVCLLESRLSSVLANLATQAGWEAVCAPAVVEAEADPREVEEPLSRLCRGEASLAVFHTGTGADRLHRLAGELGLGEAFLRALRSVSVAVRGPKPAAVLGRWGIRPAFSAASPFTTAELCRALEVADLGAQAVFVQHHGEPNGALVTYLAQRGATPVEALPYRWALPEDLSPLQGAVRRLVDGEIDALLITSRPQVLHLFQVASQMGAREALHRALASRVTVAAVGPVARRALEERGVSVAVQPAVPKMAPLVHELTRYFQQRHGR